MAPEDEMDEETEEQTGEQIENEQELQAQQGEETTISNQDNLASTSSTSSTSTENEFDKAREEVSSKPEEVSQKTFSPKAAKSAKENSGEKDGQSEQTVLAQDRLDHSRVIEAALFLSNKPLAYPELALIAKTSVKKAKEVAERLSKEYALRSTSIELVCDAVQATMQVKGDYLAPVAALSKNIEMSRKATRMLALVAKKGKLLQSELKKYFRGDIYAYIAELKELGYVSSEKSGNTRILKTTEKFRENFQLGSGGQAALEAAAAKAESELKKEEEQAANAEAAKQEAVQVENKVMEAK